MGSVVVAVLDLVVVLAVEVALALSFRLSQFFPLIRGFHLYISFNQEAYFANPFVLDRIVVGVALH